jgi:hypothetical protein
MLIQWLIQFNWFNMYTNGLLTMGFVGVQVKDNDYNLNNLTSNPLQGDNTSKACGLN